eukprot:1139865-Pelagomonas_calceolata.AAC.6
MERRGRLAVSRLDWRSFAPAACDLKPVDGHGSSWRPDTHECIGQSMMHATCLNKPFLMSSKPCALKGPSAARLMAWTGCASHNNSMGRRLASIPRAKLLHNAHTGTHCQVLGHLGTSFRTACSEGTHAEVVPEHAPGRQGLLPLFWLRLRQADAMGHGADEAAGGQGHTDGPAV